MNVVKPSNLYIFCLRFIEKKLQENSRLYQVKGRVLNTRNRSITSYSLVPNVSKDILKKSN